MPWYKSWLDTRSRFLIGLALIGVAACGIVLQYPAIQRIVPAVGVMNVPDGPLTAAIEESVETMRTYRGFVWRQWFSGNLIFLATLFAALLGSGGPLSGSARGLMFSLALPVSRHQWLGTHIALGLAELFALAVVPSLAISLLSPTIGQQFSAAEAFVHGLFVFAGATVYFGAAVFLSSLLDGVWRPLLLTCLIAIVVSIAEFAFDVDGLRAVMSAESYFRGGSLPWIGLPIAAALTAAFFYAASAQIARRDF